MREGLPGAKGAPAKSFGRPHAPRYTGWLRDRQTFEMVGLALVVGVMAGLSAYLLHTLLSLFHELFFVHGAAALSFLGPYCVVLLPAVGGLVVGLMVVFLAQEARGAGVSDVVLAVQFKASRMRPRVAGVKVAATSLAIGSGGSAGIEGPIVQIGSAIGSAVGQRLRLTEEGVRIALAAGAAAGIAATFNTPLAGVFFALEVILIDFSSRSFGLVVLAAVIANVVARLTMGDEPVFVVPQHALVHPVELLLYLMLGVLSAVVGVAFTHVLDRFDATFARWAFPRWLKPAAGGLVVGAIGLAFPQLLGLGYDTIEAALENRLPLGLMAALVVAKLIATSITVGSGSSGGVIGPSLYLGAMLGGAMGVVFHSVFPELTASPGAYALVGMGAVFAATAHAPITAIFTVFELANGYLVILPLMLSCVTSAFLAHRISPHTIYSVSLNRRGIDIQVGKRGLPPLPGMVYLDLQVQPESMAAGKRVRDLVLPSECVLVSVRRKERVLIPRGNTLLRPGDGLYVACTPQCEKPLRDLMETPNTR